MARINLLASADPAVPPVAPVPRVQTPQPTLEVALFVGDLLQVHADAICTSTNPWLSLQAGSGGSVRMAGGHALQGLCDRIVAAEHAATGRRFLPLGSAHPTEAGALNFKAVIHCVAIDAFHGSSPETIVACVKNAIDVADRLHLDNLAMPVFATGHGRFPFEDALAAMIRALEEHRPALVQSVCIVVPDVDRAETARSQLREAFGFVPVVVPAGWWANLYEAVLHGNYLRLPSEEFDAFVAEARRVLTETNAAGLKPLLWAPNWRNRIVAAWLAGLKGYSHLAPRIGDLLLESEVTFAGQGYCFALASFADAASAGHLCRYLDRWLHADGPDYDQDWALASLEHIDERRSTTTAAPYLAPGGPWEEFCGTRMREDRGRTILKEMMEVGERHLAPPRNDKRGATEPKDGSSRR